MWVTLAEMMADIGHYSIDGTTVRAHVPALEVKGNFINRVLAARGAGPAVRFAASPTTGLDGPCAVYRWADWLGDPLRDERVVRRHPPERIIDLSFGRDDDRSEGLVLLDGLDGAREIPVICNSPAPTRTVRCDRFHLPLAT